MRAVRHWWVRVLLDTVIIAVAAYLVYHLADRQYSGPHPDDSDADLGFFYGTVCAAAMSAIAMFVYAAVEGILLWRRSTEQADCHPRDRHSCR